MGQEHLRFIKTTATRYYQVEARLPEPPPMNFRRLWQLQHTDGGDYLIVDKPTNSIDSITL
jgi:hypothetical protein